MVDATSIDPVLTRVGLPPALALVRLHGGTGDVYRVDLKDGSSVVLKNFEGKKALPALDAFASNIAASAGIPVSKYLLVDHSCSSLPFPFALMSLLPGEPATSFADRQDYRSLFVQIGDLARRLHTIRLPGFGALQEPEYVDNEAYMRSLAEHAFSQFARYGADAELTRSLRHIFDRDFDAIVPATLQPVFAHDDLHPGNILALETDAGLEISGLIDFGNARAQAAVMDLAKTIFICEHMAPGSGPSILEGYGPINHPQPQAALAYYTMLHRVIMWWWLRHIGVLATPDQDSDLMQALQRTASSQAVL